MEMHSMAEPGRISTSSAALSTRAGFSTNAFRRAEAPAPPKNSISNFSSRPLVKRTVTEFFIETSPYLSSVRRRSHSSAFRPIASGAQPRSDPTAAPATADHDGRAGCDRIRVRPPSGARRPDEIRGCDVSRGLDRPFEQNYLSGVIQVVLCHTNELGIRAVGRLWLQRLIEPLGIEVQNRPPQLALQLTQVTHYLQPCSRRRRTNGRPVLFQCQRPALALES